MTVGESVLSSDGSLKVTLDAFDPTEGVGQLRIEELGSNPGRFFVTAKFAKGGDTRIDYKTFDVHKPKVYEISNLNKSEISSIEIISVSA